MAVCLAGCAGIGREFDNRGGFVDAQADLWIYPAHGQGARILRAYALQASLVQLMSTAPLSSMARAGMVNQVINANGRLTEVMTCNRTTQCFYFDSVMKEYEDALLGLAMMVFDAESRRSLIARSAGLLTSSRSTGVLLTAIVMVASDAFDTGRALGALYRDLAAMQVQFFINEIESGPAEHRAAANGVAAVYRAAPANINAWKNALSQTYSAGIDPIASSRNFKMIQGFIRYSCESTGMDANALKNCAGDMDFDLLTVPLGTCALEATAAVTNQDRFCRESYRRS